MMFQGNIIMSKEMSFASQVEQALVDFYLKSSGHYGNSKMFGIDVLEATLSLALEQFLVNGKDVRQILKEAAPAKNTAKLFEGVYSFPTNCDRPNFFQYLVLACYIVASDGDNTTDNNFRKNLSRFYGYTQSFVKLDGLPKLWLLLQEWMIEHKEGLSLRPFHLSRNDKFKHLGEVYHFAFPTWRDKNALKGLYRIEEVRQPKDIIDTRFSREFDRRDGKFSVAFKDSWQRFKYRYNYGVYSPMIYQDPFWKVVQSVISEKDTVNNVQSEFLLDENLTPSCSLVIDDFDLLESQVVFYPSSKSFDIADALDNGQAYFESCQAELHATCFKYQIIPFIKKDFDLIRDCVIRSDEEFQEGLLLLNCTYHDWLYHQLRAKKKYKIDNNYHIFWGLLKYELDLVFDYLEQQSWYLNNIKTKRVTASAIDFVMAIRCHNNFLYRENLPIKIKVNLDGNLTIKYGQYELLSKVVNEGDEIILPYDSNIEGNVRLELTENTDEQLSQIKNLNLQKTSIIHNQLGRYKATDWRRIEEIKLEGCKDQRLLPKLISETVIKDTEKNDLTSRFLTLLEAIYFRGKQGWAEYELLPLIKNILSIGANVAWDVLRLLQEADWLYVTQACKYGVRHWWLKEPMLIELQHQVIALRGAIPINLAEKFSNVVFALGGQYYALAGVGDLSIDTYIAIGVNIQDLSEKLGINTDSKQTNLLISLPKDWPSKEIDILTYYEAKAYLTWDWFKGQFSKNPIKDHSIEGNVKILCFRRAKGDLADLYVIYKHDKAVLVTEVRTAALIEAYRQAKQVMFEVNDNVLIRNTLNGYMPYPVARFLWQITALNSGLIFVEGASKYAYPLAKSALEHLQKIFGSEVLGLKQQKVECQQHSANMLSRHRLHVRYLIEG